MSQELAPFICICSVPELSIKAFGEFLKWRLFANLCRSDEGLYMVAVALHADILSYMMHGSAELCDVAMKCVLCLSR